MNVGMDDRLVNMVVIVRFSSACIRVLMLMMFVVNMSSGATMPPDITEPNNARRCLEDSLRNASRGFLPWNTNRICKPIPDPR